MKLFMIVFFSSSCFFVESNGQELLFGSPTEDVQNVQAGIYPPSTTMLRGGQEKTATGTLKALVIFVRYLDDTQNTASWPDYTVLPSWAQTFIDPSIPSNNIFTPLNLSDFFDRSSGGDGNGNLGQFHVIGDIVYVTTKHNQISYQSDSDVFEEVLLTLDDPNEPYNINFHQYDNWQFMRGDTLFNHYYKPGVGDGIVDHIWIINRGSSRDGVAAEKGLGGAIYVTNDGDTIKSTSGSRMFLEEKYITTPWIVCGPAHEYCHYLFGGGQYSGHFDGFSYYNYGNRGRINSFALMCAENNGYMSGYEKYRLGWLNPSVINTNTNNFVLGDTHINNEAVIIPLQYDGTTGWLKEYYFIENYETRNEYSGANPFLISDRFSQHIFTHGLLVYHVKNENFYIAQSSDISIVPADGRWSWNLVQGASTPYDRSDDLIGKITPTYHTGFTHRDYITINVGGVANYTDYACLIHHNPTNPAGWRYNSDDFLGTKRDFFNIDYNNTFTRYSNPAAYLGDNSTATNSGFQILNFNSSTKEFTLSVQLDNSAVLSLSPSKPQNLKSSLNATNQAVLTWVGNLEPNATGYKIYKAKTSGGEPSTYTYVTSVPNSTTTWTDNEITIGDPSYKVFYKISAISSNGKESIQSDYSYTNYVSNTLTANTTFNGNIVAVEKDFTIPSGITLSIQPVSTLNFANGSSLIVNGTLISNGTTTNKVTFDFIAQNSTTTNGIKVNTGGSINISHSVVKNAYRGIFINESNAAIDNCEFFNCYSGVHLYRTNYTADDPYITNNFMHDNHFGIVMYYSSPYLTGNEFSVNYIGVGCADFSSAYLGYAGSLGNNYIHNNQFGVFAYGYSNPFLGRSTCTLQGGNNRIESNSYKDLYTNTYCTIIAENNWWGTIQHVSSQFYVGTNCSLDYDPWLTSVPQFMLVPNREESPEELLFNKKIAGLSNNESFTAINKDSLVAANINVGLENEIASSFNPEWPIFWKLLYARNLIDVRKVKFAQKVCRDIIASFPDSSLSYYALDLLWRASRKNDKDSLVLFLNNISNAQQKKPLFGPAELMLAGFNKNDRLKNIDRMLKKYKNEPIIEFVLFQKFLYYWYEESNRDQARLVANQLAILFPGSESTLDAFRHLGEDNPQEGKKSFSKESQSDNVHLEKPLNYELLGNYPNPFNPSTTISYALPYDSQVEIEIFDLMGRKIKNFFYSSKSFGYHNTVWDGKNDNGIQVASGIYIYKIKAHSLEQTQEKFEASSKFILMK